MAKTGKGRRGSSKHSSAAAVRRLAAAWIRYDVLRQKLGYSRPGELIWFTQGPDRYYEAVADGLGGGYAAVVDSPGMDRIQYWYQEFSTETEAVAAIRQRAIEDKVLEDDDD